MSTKRSKRFNGRRGGNSKQMPRVQTLQLGRSVGGFPDKIRTTLKYSSIVNVTSTAAAYNSAVLFRTNDIFDVDAAGAQPMWRDTYAAIYLSYVVIGCRFRIRMLNTDDVDTAQSGYYIDADIAATATSGRQAREMSHGKYEYLSSSNNSASKAVLHGSWDHKSYIGTNPLLVPKAGIAASPSIYHTVIGWNLSGGTSLTSFDVMVEYDVEFAILTQASLS